MGMFLNNSTQAVERRTNTLLDLPVSGSVRKVPIAAPRTRAINKPKPATAKVQPQAFKSQSK